jgi:hypothetical protein
LCGYSTDRGADPKVCPWWRSWPGSCAASKSNIGDRLAEVPDSSQSELPISMRSISERMSFRTLQESEKQFFYEVADVQITFLTDGSGRATGLVLRQDGRDMPAQRIE